MASTSVIKKTPSAIKNAPKSNNFSWEFTIPANTTAVWSLCIISLEKLYGLDIFTSPDGTE